MFEKTSGYQWTFLKKRERKKWFPSVKKNSKNPPFCALFNLSAYKKHWSWIFNRVSKYLIAYLTRFMSMNMWGLWIVAWIQMKILNIFVNHEYDTAKCHELVNMNAKMYKTLWNSSWNIAKRLSKGHDYSRICW